MARTKKTDQTPAAEKQKCDLMPVVLKCVVIRVCCVYMCVHIYGVCIWCVCPLCCDDGNGCRRQRGGGGALSIASKHRKRMRARAEKSVGDGEEAEG